METILNYVAFALLFVVFQITMFLNCDMYSDIKIKSVRNSLVRKFLYLRRCRVGAGYFLLSACGARFVINYMLIPIFNVFMRLFCSDVEYVARLASPSELWIVAIASTTLLCLYVADRKLYKRLVEEFSDGEG